MNTHLDQMVIHSLDTQQYMRRNKNTLLPPINISPSEGVVSEQAVIENNNCDACLDVEARQQIPIYEEIKDLPGIKKTVVVSEDKVN